jgi:NAD(P)-dependent dehydrogenase (short-subunit alcohol dehydrogenase family)
MNVEALVIPTDVTRQAQIDQMVGQALHQWGKIDILVSNAGEYIRSPIENLSDQDLQRSMEVNFFAGVHAIQAVLPHMRGQKSGHIIAVTSMDGRLGVPPDAPYASAKFALTGFLEVLRQELHRSGIHVCNVMPGRVDTAMIENLKFMWVSRKIPPEAVASKILKAIEKRTPVVMLPPGAALLFYVNAFSPTISDFLTRHLRLEGWQ